MGKRVFIIALLVLGLLASGYVAVQRYRTESRNKAVELVVDWDEIQQMAAASGTTPVDVLRRFKAVGVTSVAVSQETVKDAIDRGDAKASERALAVPAGADPGRASRAERYLHFSLSELRIMHTVAAGSSFIALTDGIPVSYLQQLPIGLPERAISAAGDSGVGIVARLVSFPGASPKAINFMMADAKRQGAKTIVFQGDSILGFKGAIEDTADALARNDLYFGRVEFSKQKGDQNLAQKVKDRLIVVHSITQAEMPTLSETSIVDRFQKGVRERGVRMCYLRMYYTAGNDIVEKNAEYILAISQAIRKAGYTTAPAHAMGAVDVPRFARTLAGIGVAAGIILLIGTVVELPGVIIPILLLIACAGLASMSTTGTKAVALLSALTFPTLAALRATRNTPDTPTAAPTALGSAMWRLFGAVLTTAAGGLLIVGLLSGRDFMLRTDQFAGVKVAHMLPMLALTLLYAGGVAWKSDKWAAQKERFWSTLRDMGSNPVLIWQAIGIIAALVVVAMMVARSGNDSGIGVSGAELRFRSILDKVLYVRPRTKEFLVGYPLLLAGIAFALRGRRQWAAPLVVVGSIGLVSALNTFCHIHTPLQLSVLRVFNGTVVGLIVGAAVYCVIRNLPGKES